MTLITLGRKAVFTFALVMATVIYCVFVLIKWTGAAAVAVGTFMLFVIGAWDFAVWLFRADWRTTHGEAPIIGAVLLVGGSVIYGIGRAGANTSAEIRSWSKRQPEMLTELERVLATYDRSVVSPKK